MPQYVFMLGRHPAICATECWRMLDYLGFEPQLLAAEARYLTVQVEQPLPDTFLKRLGGTDRIALIVATWEHEPSAAEILEALSPLPSKWMMGVSAVGVSLPLKPFSQELKKLAQTKGSRLKFVLPGKGATQLNAAQVLFNGLHREPNAELTILQNGKNYILARTIQIQDIAAYEMRDTSRPARDAKVGMLPPKLAQIMLNIAVAEFPREQKLAILDPFCGSGTVLQEGWLAGYQMVGSDVSPAAVTAAHANLQWLHSHFDLAADKQPEIAIHDVQQPFPEEWNNSINACVTEPHLGRPLSAPLPHQEFTKRATELGRLYTAFFRHVHPVLKKTGVVLFTLPAIKTVQGQEAAFTRTPGSHTTAPSAVAHRAKHDDHQVSGFTPLPGHIIDEIEKAGYHMKQLVPKELAQFYPASDRGTLLYHRPDALVARELTLWQKT